MYVCHGAFEQVPMHWIQRKRILVDSVVQALMQYSWSGDCAATLRPQVAVVALQPIGFRLGHFAGTNQLLQPDLLFFLITRDKVEQGPAELSRKFSCQQRNIVHIQMGCRPASCYCA
jgi:hypothetical protein